MVVFSAEGRVGDEADGGFVLVAVGIENRGSGRVFFGIVEKELAESNFGEAIFLVAGHNLSKFFRGGRGGHFARVGGVGGFGAGFRGGCFRKGGFRD